jgi:hypothetical protein
MPEKDAKGELASARLAIPLNHYTRTKGRNGWFKPRAIEAAVHRDADGTPLITIRQYSRRPPLGDGAPSQCTLTVALYREFAQQVDATLTKVLTKRELRTPKTRKQPLITG